mmetsp:Transcript_30146/g.60847  ORF Transcript_30146/g.60847 Transcript_30146/m.60847 type:complete len:227 (+) Transcript_30146:1-681(+)
MRVSRRPRPSSRQCGLSRLSRSPRPRGSPRPPRGGRRRRWMRRRLPRRRIPRIHPPPPSPLRSARPVSRSLRLHLRHALPRRSSRHESRQRQRHRDQVVFLVVVRVRFVFGVFVLQEHDARRRRRARETARPFGSRFEPTSPTSSTTAAPSLLRTEILPAIAKTIVDHLRLGRDRTDRRERQRPSPHGFRRRLLRLRRLQQQRRRRSFPLSSRCQRRRLLSHVGRR